MEIPTPYVTVRSSSHPHGTLWLGFTQDTPIGAARAAFAKRFGYEPHEVRSGPGIVLAGPVKETQP